MSEEELAAIEARAKAATEGPWAGVSTCHKCDELHLDANDTPEHTNGPRATDADLAFMRHARQDVPALVAALREARRTIEIAAGRFTREAGGPEYVCTRHNTPSCPSCLAYAMGGLKAALE